MNIYLQTLAETAQIVLPIFFLLSCGYILQRMRIIDHHFVDQGSKLVFTVALPLLVFLKVSTTNLEEVFSTGKLIYIVMMTLLSGLVCFWGAVRWIKAPEDQGVFTQGCFRSNFAIIGLAVIFNMMGDPGLAMGAVALAVVMPLYNLMSILCLSIPLNGKMSLTAIIKSLLSNPLVLSVIFALPVAHFSLSMPQIVTTTGGYFADMTLPLALLAIGASLDGRYLRNSSTLAVQASLIKTIGLPLAASVGAFLLGFDAEQIAVLFILFGCPAAASGFVMAKAMGGNPSLAANIVALSTLISIFTLTTGIYILKLVFAG